VPQERRHRGLGVERHVPGRELEEDDAERVDVAAGVGRPAARLLGAHVLGAPEGVARGARLCGGGGPGDPEVHEAHPPRLVRHQVERLEVTVDDPGAVHRGEALRRLQAERQHLLDGERPALQTGRERLSRDELHGDPPPRALLPSVVQPADVRVADLPGQLDLGTEPSLGFRPPGGIRPLDLERHLLVEHPVEGPVHGPHPALSQVRPDLVAVGHHRPRGKPRQVGPACPALVPRLVALVPTHRTPHRRRILQAVER